MEKAILVGLNIGGDKEFEYSMEELCALAEALEISVLAKFVQVLERPIAATYIGSGKAQEIADMAENLEVDYCIFEDTLSPAQLKNLQHIIKAKIMDRTGLILEIFSKRAKTREARLQVETANLQYTLPRLIGMWEAIGRQGGASGSKSSKGIGETQLELDRRWIQKRLSELNRELEAISHDREIQRSRRGKNGIPLVALVGYTNAGKSTIMNELLSLNNADEEKRVFEKDMLFATLDTQVRRIESEDKKDFLLSDTVGFVNKLPHSLIKAFRSTLEEIKYADVLLEVVDYSDERCEEQMRVTEETLRELDAGDIPVIYVMNKVDMCEETITRGIRGDRIYISAKDKADIELLLGMIKDNVYASNIEATFLIPYDKGQIVSFFNDNAKIIKQEYIAEGVYIEADVTPEIYGRYKEYGFSFQNGNIMVQ